MGGNFLEGHTLEALNVIESIDGNPPINDIKTEVTLEHVIERFDIIENIMLSMNRKNEINKRLMKRRGYRLEGGVNRRLKIITVKA